MIINLRGNIDFFMSYMKSVRNASDNTLQSYKRDLDAMAKYFEDMGVEDVARINSTNINSYILYMERQGKSGATIARNISSIKTFFRCMINNGKIKREPTENIHGPQNEKKKTEAISDENMSKIFKEISCKNPKEIRDKAMLMLMLDTGIKVSEMIELKIEDINLQYSFVTCHGRKKDKTIRFSGETNEIIRMYLGEARSSLAKEECKILFLNCFGRKMSRQGFWKMFKEYADSAGIEGMTTYSFHK